MTQANGISQCKQINARSKLPWPADGPIGGVVLADVDELQQRHLIGGDQLILKVVDERGRVLHDVGYGPAERVQRHTGAVRALLRRRTSPVGPTSHLHSLWFCMKSPSPLFSGS